MKNDSYYMSKCIELAKKGLGFVSPNPMVGSVIVYNNIIIGQGYHKKYGHDHAEVIAINSVEDKSLLCKSTIYVNLEPCSHHGKTPPCANFIVKNNLKKVVIGCIDTSSKVSGRGVDLIRKNNISVKLGVLENECIKLNERFFTFQEKKRPYIILKWAKSIDGFIAPENQDKPFWLTSDESKTLVHKWRADEDAILIGRYTAEKDNPKLTVRNYKGRNPIRILIDPNLKVSNKRQIFNSEAKTIIFNTKLTKIKDTNYYVKCNYQNMIKKVLDYLYKSNVNSIIVEGGSTTLKSFIDINLWDEARVFSSNKYLLNGLKEPKFNGKLIEKKIIGTDELKLYYNL